MRRTFGLGLLFQNGTGKSPEPFVLGRKKPFWTVGHFQKTYWCGMFPVVLSSLLAAKR